MKHEGPPLEVLVRRVSETPPDFLLAPRIGAIGEVHLPAVVHDVLKLKGLSIALPELAVFAGRDPKADRARLSIALLMCWLVADDSLAPRATDVPALIGLLRDDATDLAAHGGAARIVRDAERREELVRLTLARLQLRPAGETPEQAEDRLITLSSSERARVLQASRAAEERARKIREALVRKAAEESADKWTRE
jgi:hypothetical protein